MPWDNNTGGGGRGNNGGPWGPPPTGGGPRRPGGTPSLEDILNRGRARFGGGLPGGVPGGRWAIVGVVVVLAGIWLTQCIYTLAPQEAAVELTLGQPSAQLSEPGLHFLFWPFQTVQRVVVTENQTEIGSVSTGNQSDNEGLMLSADQNIVDVKFSVLWYVSDPAKYLFDVNDPSDMVRAAGESAMREVVGRRPAQDAFRDARAQIQDSAQQITQGILNDYNAGITVEAVRLENVAPPAEVADAFDEVQRAEQDEDRFQEEARQYANTKLGAARGQAAQIREQAAAYKDRVVKEAQGEVSHFESVFQQYARAPEVTRERLYLEAMEQVLGGARKVIVDKSAVGGVVPYLPLPGLQPGAAASGRSTSGTGAPSPANSTTLSQPTDNTVLPSASASGSSANGTQNTGN
jgi:membrane protease subunit HflK